MARGIVAKENGGPEVLGWTEFADPQPGPGQALVRIRATAVNPADVLQRRGLYPPPPWATEILGLEFAGEIAAIGPGVEEWGIGDRVCAVVASGAYADLVVVTADCLLPVPDGMSLTDAAALPEVFTTAYDNLVLRGRLAPGESTLIHGGAGGVGSAAIQLAKRLGARVLVTAGSQEKLARCAELGAEVTINYREEDFVERTKAATEGRGADVILDVMGASYLDRNLQALALEGRLVVIGFQGGMTAEFNLGLVLAKRLTVCSSSLRSRTDEEKAALAGRMREDVWPGFTDGSLRPVVDRVLPLDEIAEAHRALEASEAVGKIVLTVA